MEGTPDKVWDLMAKCIANEASEEEKALMERLLLNDKGLAKDFCLLKNFYNSRPSEEIHAEVAFIKLQLKLGKLPVPHKI